jgi:hypothetical protein
MTPSSRRRKAARCSVPDCTKQVQTRRLCKAHGGGIRCRAPDCTKLAQSRGLCVGHGGGRRCRVDGCPKLSQYKGLCLSHGGGRRCVVPGCQKFAQIRGYCKADWNSLDARNAVRSPTSTEDPAASSVSASKLAISFLMNPLEPSSSTTKEGSAIGRAISLFVNPAEPLAPSNTPRLVASRTAMTNSSLERTREFVAFV